LPRPVVFARVTATKQSQGIVISPSFPLPKRGRGTKGEGESLEIVTFAFAKEPPSGNKGNGIPGTLISPLMGENLAQQGRGGDVPVSNPRHSESVDEESRGRVRYLGPLYLYEKGDTDMKRETQRDFPGLCFDHLKIHASCFFRISCFEFRIYRHIFPPFSGS
jgi:hypothetical protein